jgi:hypothetical protein
MSFGRVRRCAPFPNSFSYPCLFRIQERIKLTDLNIGISANLLERAHRRLRIITADISHLGAQVLGLAHSLDVDGVLHLVDGAEEAARGSSDGELREREEGSGEDGTAEHSCGIDEER